MNKSALFDDKNCVLKMLVAEICDKYGINFRYSNGFSIKNVLK